MAALVHGNNVNDAWMRAKELLGAAGVRTTSRNGDVIEHPEPVVTTYVKPWQRVLFDPVRDANPFFHLLEAVWMLSGSRDVAPLKWIVPNIANYSDDGETFNAAYGYRWRQAGGVDQVGYAIDMLQRSGHTRRCVIAMWDKSDLGAESKDLPCNTQLYFKIRKGALLMTVCNRSNDIMWGLYGANAVHMSVLQEYMAARIGVAVGPMTTISDSWHAYAEVYHCYLSVRERSRAWCPADPYTLTQISVDLVPIGVPGLDELTEIVRCMAAQEMPARGLFSSAWILTVVCPMLESHLAWKAGNKALALVKASLISASDWRVACLDWYLRRLDKDKPTTRTLMFDQDKPFSANAILKGEDNDGE